MNSKNISILFITLLVIITTTSLLLRSNNKRADYTPPPADFESNQAKYKELINKAKNAIKDEELVASFNYYKEALKYYPGNQGILHEMGVLKLKLKEFKEASKIYSDLCAKSPDQPIYKVSLAFALLYQMKFEEAESVINKAIRMRPNDGRVHLISAALSAVKNKASEAVEHLRRYPKQLAISAFAEESFFDKIRNEKEFTEYLKDLDSAKEKSEK